MAEKSLINYGRARRKVHGACIIHHRRIESLWHSARSSALINNLWSASKPRLGVIEMADLITVNHFACALALFSNNVCYFKVLTIKQISPSFFFPFAKWIV